MTTKYVLVTLFILILIPSSLSGGFRVKLPSFFKGFREGASTYSNVLPNRNHEKQRGTITYTFNYINIAFNGPYANVGWDLTADFIWANCEPTEANPIYDHYSKSSDFAFIPCTDSLCPPDWNSTCPDPKQCSGSFSSSNEQDSSQVSLATDDKFTLGSLALTGPAIVFLCGTDNEGVYDDISAIIGLGWGGLSLVSQLGIGKFSYCLSSNFSDISPLFLFDSQPILTGNQVQYTPLIQSKESSGYYVNLKEISVGTELLPISNTMVLLDSFSYYSFLETEGYEKVKNALLSYVSFPQVDASNLGLDVCFSISDTSQLSSMPTITLHFEGGANMMLDPYYYLVPDDNGNYCLAILPSTSNKSYYGESVSVLGYQLQSDMLMFFNLTNSMLSYMPADCKTSIGQQYSVTSSSNLILSTGDGIYFQILFAFMFQVLVGFVF